ncbi:MAG: TRAP transporter large permease subunit [Candidatus Aminicenantes bacterium]|nr:TRAP transporter large permease subunit [Candidatus Aminicenantes bacterium]
MGLVIVIVFFMTLLLSVPIGIVLGITALAGLMAISFDPDFFIFLPQKFMSGLDSFPLLAIPFFILAGSIMSHGGIARRIVDLTLVFFGRIRGGLGIVVTVSTFFFGAICGSGSAKTAAIGSVMFPEMKRNKYPSDFATALFASAGGASSLVPPSIDLIIIGVVANISVGGVFAAGILPSIVYAFGLVLVATIFAHKLKLPLAPKIDRREKLRIIRDGILPMLMIVIVLGGIYGGIFTPTEAAAVAVIYGFCLSFFVYKELRFKELQKALLTTASLSGVVLIVLGTASMLSFVMTFERIPHQIAESIALYASNWIVFVLFVNVVFLFLGMVMDTLPAIIVLLPIIMPVAVSLGMEPIHLGILVEANVGLGMITPPVGICLYVACGISKIPIEKSVKALLPFLLVMALTVLVISYVPELTLFLPRLMGFIP